MAVEQLFPRKPTEGAFLGNTNFDTRFEGRSSPAFDVWDMTNSAEVGHFFVDCIETIAPAGTTYGAGPRQYAGANNVMFRLDNGERTTDTTFTAGTGVVQGMCIGDNGSGAKILLVGFGSSTAPRIAYRDLTTDTTPWTTQTSSTYAQFWLITKAGADLYAVTDAGVAILGEYRISKCPRGNDPRLAASWGNGLECGTPEWGITGLAAIGDSIVAGKPDGLYYYNDQTKRFENVLPHLVDSPHAVNGKGMRSVTNGVLYPTHDGHLYFFDGVAVQDVTPYKSLSLPRDIGTSRITGIRDCGDYVAIVTECWQNTTGPSYVVKVDGGTATNLTSNTTDGSLATGGDVGGLGSGSTDYLYVGYYAPFEAVVVRVTRNVNAATEAWDTPEYSDGSSFTAFSGIVDWSQLGTSGVSLVNTGFPPGSSNSVLTWPDIDAYKLMKSQTVAFGGSVGDLTAYWVRFPVGTTGFTASTTIDEVEVVPGRAGLPDAGVLTQASNFTNRDRAGGVSHVLLGRRERTVGFVWHDVYAVHTLGGVWALGWHTGRTPGFSNRGQSLVLWGRNKQMMISEGPTRDPARTHNAGLATFSTSTVGPTLHLTPYGTYLGDQTHRKRLQGFYVDTQFVQAGDEFSVYASWDEQDIVHVGSFKGGPAYVEVTGMGEGRKLRAWLAHQYWGGLATPQVTGVWVEYENVGEPFEFWRDRDAQTPETA